MHLLSYLIWHILSDERFNSCVDVISLSYLGYELLPLHTVACRVVRTPQHAAVCTGNCDSYSRQNNEMIKYSKYTYMYIAFALASSSNCQWWSHFLAANTLVKFFIIGFTALPASVQFSVQAAAGSVE